MTWYTWSWWSCQYPSLDVWCLNHSMPDEKLQWTQLNMSLESWKADWKRIPFNCIYICIHIHNETLVAPMGDPWGLMGHQDWNSHFTWKFKKKSSHCCGGTVHRDGGTVGWWFLNCWHEFPRLRTNIPWQLPLCRTRFLRKICVNYLYPCVFPAWLSSEQVVTAPHVSANSSNTTSLGCLIV